MNSGVQEANAALPLTLAYRPLTVVTWPHYCCVDYMFAFLQCSDVEILPPNVMALGSGSFRRRLSYQGHKTSIFTKETPENSFVPFRHVMAQGEGGHLQTRNWTAIRHQFHWHCELGLLNLHNCEKWMSVSYESPSLVYSVIAAEGLKMNLKWIPDKILFLENTVY